ncbi:MAG: class I SAM-dependent methyltransferase [Pseudomonadota bacterium]|nr:class I SAM-dependent methyltransferase [Pseudomonadota bacterium]
MVSLPRPIELDGLDPIPSTLAIPLIGRAEARRAFPSLGFEDAAAEAIAARLVYEGAPTMRGHRAAVHGSIVRTQIVDEAARAFLSAHPGCTVLTLGAGLCTRRARLGAAAASGSRWIDVDLPAVAALRRGVFPEAVLVTGDLAAAGFVDRVLGALPPEQPCLVIAEGVLMFLDPAGADRVFEALHARLPAGSAIVFDRTHPAVVRTRRLVAAVYPSIRVTGATYHSGIARIDDLPLRWPRFRVRAADLYSRRYTGFMRFANRLLSALLGGNTFYDVALLEVT